MFSKDKSYSHSHFVFTCCVSFSLKIDGTWQEFCGRLHVNLNVFGISNSVGSMTDPWRIPDFSLYFFFQRSILQPYTFCIYMVCVVFIRNSWHSSRILRSLIRQFKVFSHVVYVEVKNTNSVGPKTDPCSTSDLFSPKIDLTTIHVFYLHVCPYTSI